MPRKKTNQNADIKEKLEYLGLDLNNIPKDLSKYKKRQWFLSQIR